MQASPFCLVDEDITGELFLSIQEGNKGREMKGRYYSPSMAFPGQGRKELSLSVKKGV